MSKNNSVSNRIVIINIISSFLLQGISFFTTPIFTRILGTEQFGMYAVFNSWVLIFSCFIGLSISSAIATGIYNFDDYLGYRNSILLSSTLIGVGEILIVFILIPVLSEIIGVSHKYLFIIAILSLAHYIVGFAQLVFIYEKKAVNNLALSLVLSVCSVGLSLYFIYLVDYEQRYWARICGVSCTYITVAIFIWIALYAKKPVGIRKEYILYGISVGLPIVFHSLSQQVLGQADRVMMQMYNVSAGEIGIYSFFYTLVAVVSIVLSALNSSWCPFYYDYLSTNNSKEIEKKSKNYIELFTVVCLGFLLLAREVSYIMADENFWEGVNVIPILVLAVYFTFMYQFPVNFEFFYKRTKLIAIGTIGAGIINIILNALMIPRWGMYGAALATALSYLLLFCAHYFIVINMKEQRYQLGLWLFIKGLLVVILGIIMFYIFDEVWYIRWGIGCVLGIVELYRIIKRRSVF